jgi:hypothetical protein
MLWLSRMKSMTLSNCHMDVCGDCHEWNRDSVIDFIRDNHNIRPRDNSIVSSISFVTITTYIHSAICISKSLLFCLYTCTCHEYVTTWTYVVIVTNEIDVTIELPRGRMLWLSLMKSMTLSNCYVEVCCDCREWNRWHYRIVTWTYVVVTITTYVHVTIR